LIDSNDDDVGGGNISGGGDRASDNDDKNVAVNDGGGKKDSCEDGANVNNDDAANDDNVNDDASDDAAVNKIVDHINASDISSMSSNSKGTTVSVDSLGTLPKDFYDGYYDDNLFPSLKHYYGTKPGAKKVFFNVFKGKRSSNVNYNIKLNDYIICRKCQGAKERFIFAGILCKHTDYYRFHNNKEKKFMSTILA